MQPIDPSDRDLPTWLRDLVARSSPDVARFVEDEVRQRGLEWLEAHRGLLEAQARFIASL
jgi:hypothetical protein